jgi:hypothetical protein
MGVSTEVITVLEGVRADSDSLEKSFFFFFFFFFFFRVVVIYNVGRQRPKISCCEGFPICGRWGDE